VQVRRALIRRKKRAPQPPDFSCQSSAPVNPPTYLIPRRPQQQYPPQSQTDAPRRPLHNPRTLEEATHRGVFLDALKHRRPTTSRAPPRVCKCQHGTKTASRVRARDLCGPGVRERCRERYATTLYSIYSYSSRIESRTLLPPPPADPATQQSCTRYSSTVTSYPYRRSPATFLTLRCRPSTM
jgi:hypothetical protein